MTYYEELGVSPTASVEEIREAYKQLARLLHPDTLRDDRSRIVAECQMKRLNGVYETLMHSERRRAYDQSLCLAPGNRLMLASECNNEPWYAVRARALLGSLRNSPGNACAVAGCMAMMVLAWILPTPRDPAEPRISAARKAPRSPSSGASISAPIQSADPLIPRLRQKIIQMDAERKAAITHIGVLERKLAESAGETYRDHRAIVPALPGSVPDPAPLSIAENWIPAAKNDLAGAWHYANTNTEPASKGLYPPEYIEAVIREESGYLIGRFRARYRVPDQAISSDVVFEFSGKGYSAAARLRWIGLGGARGELSLKLMTHNTMEISWIATDMGHSLGLGSGRAVLARRHPSSGQDR